MYSHHKSYLPENSEVLDLGGGPGRYTIALAQLGHTMHLADLSQTLLNQAKEKINDLKLSNVKTIKQVNATDLSCYEDSSFDAVLLFGPLYHLTIEDERISCINEVRRVLKSNGLVFASFIPYLNGAIGIVERMFVTPDQVNLETLDRVFSKGIFNNNANRGFQEGYYPTSDELLNLFTKGEFSKLLLRSIRGWGSGREEQIFKLKNDKPEEFAAVIELINNTADNPAIIEMCSHAIYVGKKM